MSGNPVISSSKVAGTAVFTHEGQKLGSIDHLKIDKHAGVVRYAVLEFGGFLGMGMDRYPIPWRLLTYEPTLDGYVVPLSQDQLENAPRYASSNVPEYTEEFGRRVFGHYGVSWA